MATNEPFALPRVNRTARIGSICIISASQSAVVQIGDRKETNAKLQALALQRQEGHTSAGDVYFESYPIFYRERPAFDEADDDHSGIAQLQTINVSPNITVGCIRVTASGSSASIQAGNGMHITADSRIKHIRQYPRPTPVPPAGC